ncbi:MAG TPA: rod shape-determining protein MreD [Alphaproteobacteria bacterium]
MTEENELWHRIESQLRAMLPFVLTLFLAVLCAVPLGVPGLAPVTPLLPAIAVFYWTVYRPDLLPMTATLLVGLVHDALTGAPFGLTALVLLVLQAVAGTQRRFFTAKALPAAWLGFAVIGTGAVALWWLAASALALRPMPISPSLFQAILTVALYPVIAWPLGTVQRELLGDLEARAR